jgi:hypothetical protein
MSDLQPVKIQPQDGPLPEMPIDAKLIRDGDPVSRGAFMIQTGDRRLTGGMWECECGTFEWQMDGDEIAYCFEGRFSITTDGDDTLTIGPGEMVLLPHGMKGTWRILEPIRTFFVVRTVAPMALTQESSEPVTD